MQEIDPNSMSGEMAESSDYTKEALESFKRKLSTYIEAVDKSYEELLLHCRWFDCHQSFPNYIRLHVHFLECHLNNVPELVCLWDSCQKNNTFQEHNQLLRHTLLHTFFEDCIVNTSKLLKAHHKAWNFVCCGISCQKPAYLQRSTEKFLWNPIILIRGFECQWKDCDYTIASSDNKLSEENYEFYCQIQGCSYQSTKLSAYRAHYRRYHLSSNPDGLWYSCHLCSSYRARKPFTITHHLKSVHSLKPPDGRSRFTYSFDECSQTYQLAGKPPAPCTVRAIRKLAPKLVVKQ
ncbi:putative zinc finger protein [Schistosoma mansoni]|uniref:putative zinc finger protein n=1 Tax=Schistosoma mansoni TaxID=6183 RepID=UPI0001A63D7B|nr:putative zinc finger protein [Schistosoma mansoni]|eukprot:XP_018652154.1 putative zinc finger protein [Schistosoma mansoni]